MIKIKNYLNKLRSPKTGSVLSVKDDNLIDSENNSFKIVNEIPRFVNEVNYADSFGFQWNFFDKLQLDGFSNNKLSETRFYNNTRWKQSDIAFKDVLEVGSGAGRFTEILLKANTNLYSVDYSNAVEANWKNNHKIRDYFICQADIYQLPFKKHSFDYVFCFGVLQHTPYPEKSFSCLVEQLKPGGEIAIDIYKKTWKSAFNTKYWFRPITLKINKELLLKLIKWYVPKWFPISTFFLKIPFLGRFLSQLLPILNYSLIYPELSRDELLEWAILDTFDMLSPSYDSPQTLKTIKNWAHKNSLKIIYAGTGDNGYVLVAKKEITLN